MAKNTTQYGTATMAPTPVQKLHRLQSKQTEIDSCNKLQQRLNSFSNSNWRSKKSQIQLALAGFRYTGESDRVECEDCKKRVVKWSKDDDPLETHFRLSPQCPYLKSLGYSVDLQIPKFRKYANYNTRLQSMERLPSEYSEEVPSFESLARSGFFYQGTFDRMNCFHCGLVLRDWEPDTVPNTVHKQFGKNCGFIERVLKNENSKGNFIQIRRSNHLSSNSADNTEIKHNIGQLNTNLKTTSMAQNSHENMNSGLNMTLDMCMERTDSGQKKMATVAVQPALNYKRRPIGIFSSEYQRQHRQHQQQRALEVDSASVDVPDSLKSSKENGQTPVSKSSSLIRPSLLNTKASVPTQSEMVTAGAASTPVITPIEQAVNEMGYSLDVINQAITERQQRGEGNFPDATTLCLAVMDLTESTSTTPSENTDVDI
ncbi:baculoviral IAP repeat-containing protein 2 [Patella vulgata]|uniref:baculoviral IAP repeat-containing protein 2 n=1 Tax=Patella vulgata TaxID=6465 RepID=UPI00217FB230|nr:baculoviral IAP repeat-containing protein 2 [Patella vulgata]